MARDPRHDILFEPIYLWMLAAWHPEPARMLATNPRVKQLTELVQARPAIARVWEEHKED